LYTIVKSNNFFIFHNLEKVLPVCGVLNTLEYAVTVVAMDSRVQKLPRVRGGSSTGTYFVYENTLCMCYYTLDELKLLFLVALIAYNGYIMTP